MEARRARWGQGGQEWDKHFVQCGYGAYPIWIGCLSGLDTVPIGGRGKDKPLSEIDRKAIWIGSEKAGGAELGQGRQIWDRHLIKFG